MFAPLFATMRLAPVQMKPHAAVRGYALPLCTNSDPDRRCKIVLDVKNKPHTIALFCSCHRSSLGIDGDDGDDDGLSAIGLRLPILGAL